MQYELLLTQRWWRDLPSSTNAGNILNILKISKHRSIEGLSVVAFELEVIGYFIALAYCLHKQLPFSAYGELAFLLVQAIILVAIILVAVIYYYSQPLGITTWLRALLYCALAPTVLGGQIDPVLFEALYASQHAIFFLAKVPQIWENFKTDTIDRFLRSEGLEKYIITFKAEEVDMATLVHMNDEDLKSLGILMADMIRDSPNLIHSCFRPSNQRKPTMELARGYRILAWLHRFRKVHL